jgi:outer membrane protein
MIKRLFLISILILISTAVFADVNIYKIGVINLEEVISTVFAGKSGVIKDIKNEKEDFKNKLKRMKDEIMKYEAIKLKTTDTNKKIAYEKKIDELKKQYNDYYRVKKYEISKKIDNIQGKLMNEIRRVVTKVAEREGYSVILDINSDDIFYYSIDIEITQKVIEYFEKKYGKEEE